jgi:predicted phage baseplate assembly protein
MASGKDSASGPNSPTLRELVQLAGVDVTADNLTQLTFATALTNSYRLDSFALNANLVQATHGETVKEESLGGGDASESYQQFTLLQQPLTYVSAPTPTGAESTLRIRVNDVLWQEVPTLFNSGPQDRVFVSRTGDDGKTTVEFGDGITGARLPTTTPDKVRAVYRKGIGTDGNVKAGQLTLLLTRPLGVREVINPADAVGGEDREETDDARRTAPLTVLTLDRVVSLQDYEDFVRPFAGIGKAQATWGRIHGERCVLLTVAGTGGNAVLPGSALYKHLLTALGQAGDPFVGIRLASHREMPFRIAGQVKVDPDNLPGKVLTAVRDALKAQFGFDARDFGQPVVYSEVLAAIQAVPGVTAATLSKLYRQGDPAAGLNMTLVPRVATLNVDGTLAGAEVLTLDLTSLDDLGLMT